MYLDAVRRLVRTERRLPEGVAFVPCAACGSVVDLATAPLDAHLCAPCVYALGTRR